MATRGHSDIFIQEGLLADLAMVSPVCTPTDNWWNLNVTEAPIDPNSATIVNTIKGYLQSPDPLNGRLSADFGYSYGIPYVAVTGTTPLVTVRVDRYPTQSDPGPEGSWTATGTGWKESRYPIPAEAQSDVRYREKSGSTEGDRHLLVLDIDRWVLYEFSYAIYGYTSSYVAPQALPGKWSAGAVAVFDLKTNNRRPEGWTSTDAAGLAVLPGLIRLDELLSPFPIQHALRFAVPYATNTWYYPASHPSATDANGQPMGLRMRLKSNINFASRGITNPYSLKLFTAMQTYGILLADRCGKHNNMIFQGTMDTHWNNVPTGYNKTLFDLVSTDMRKLYVTDFDAIELGWNG